ncbi:hypothetical protein [Cohnella sp. GCM10012308]|uniref:hypothetical protein n=1 Tax=Cohnella sp. GCM10012308 TaxID=3317329 RepID=UPI00360B2F02
MKSLPAWIICAFIMFGTSGILIYLGVDRFKNYYMSENYSSLNKYAYVGGDAYNYIINTNLMNGYFILAAAAFIAGTLLLGIGFVVHAIYKHQEDAAVNHIQLKKQIVASAAPTPVTVVPVAK